MPRLQVLVVDDEAAIRQVLSAQLESEGYQVEHVGTGMEALDRLAKGDIDVALCDVRLPDINGIEVMRRTIAARVETSFLVMTAYASVNTAIEAMKGGALDYLIKPVRSEDLAHRLRQASQLLSLREENRRLRSLVPEATKGVCTLSSPASQNVFRLAARVARSDGTVLVTGESGTGKGVVARSIHQTSGRHGNRLVNINCGAIPRELLESEFFGHLKGAFTGADRAKRGLMLEADGGTLVLDEIGEMPIELQVKLLHAIEDKEIRAVGSERSRRVDVRIIAVTNKNLEEMMKDGRFREDLYYRLNVLQIHVPPLRERPADVAELIRFNLIARPAELGLEGRYTIEREAEEFLLEYDWPGNIRELQNAIDRALILADGEVITVAELPPQVTRPRASAGAAPATGTLRDLARQFEIQTIQQAIAKAGGDRRAAAQVLGIGLSTLYRKLEESPETDPGAV